MKADIEWTFAIPHWVIVLALVLVTLYVLAAMATAVLTFMELWNDRKLRAADSEGESTGGHS